MTAKFEIGKAADGTYYFHLISDSGKSILSSESYVAKGSAEKGIQSVKINAALDERYERRHGVNGRPYFILKAANEQIIGRSQMYASPADLELGIESVKATGPIAVVEDLTKAKSA